MNTVKYLVAIFSLSLLCACGGGGGSGPTSSTNGAPPTNTLSGTVMFKGAPLPGVTITAINTNSDPSTVFALTTTDANGNYSFSNLATFCDSCDINYQFWASKPGYAFTAFMASNPSGKRAAYLWYSPAQNWYVNTGAAITRAGFNGQFSVTAGPSLVFNVINFNSTVNNSVTGANFTAYDGSNPLVNLAATGQQISYAAGDDASLQKGVAWPSNRFTDNQDGTVTDNLTGLIWLKNAGCLAPATWPPALTEVNQLASGACGLTDGSLAGQWRLPNLIELESIVDVSTSSPAVTVGSPFTNVSNGIYWSSTVYWGSTNAWAIGFSDGSYINDGISNAMQTSTNAVWAVKGSGGGAVKLQATGGYIPYASGDDGTIESGVPLTFTRMLDNGNGTVTDAMTGLVWLKQADCINQTWASALATVNALASGQCGLTDGSTAGSWRMPNRSELQSLADRAQNNMGDSLITSWPSSTQNMSSIPNVFDNLIEFQYYWTSTTDAASTSNAWAVFSCDFGVYAQAKTNTAYALAVRSN